MVTIAPDRGSARIRLAGHPPPLLIADRAIVPLEPGRVGPPLGVVEDAEWVAADHPLPDGWALLLYTDGLIEGRTGVGTARLGGEGLEAMVRGALETGFGRAGHDARRARRGAQRRSAARRRRGAPGAAAVSAPPSADGEPVVRDLGRRAGGGRRARNRRERGRARGPRRRPRAAHRPAEPGGDHGGRPEGVDDRPGDRRARLRAFGRRELPRPVRGRAPRHPARDRPAGALREARGRQSPAAADRRRDRRRAALAGRVRRADARARAARPAGRGQRRLGAGRQAALRRLPRVRRPPAVVAHPGP